MQYRCVAFRLNVLVKHDVECFPVFPAGGPQRCSFYIRTDTITPLPDSIGSLEASRLRRYAYHVPIPDRLQIGSYVQCALKGCLPRNVHTLRPKHQQSPPKNHPAIVANLPVPASIVSHTTMDSPVDLVIRFTTSIPDLVLTVSSPRSTSALSLKQQIRAELPSSAASSRLRLISSGKVLPDGTAIAKAINIPPPPPRIDTNAPSPKDKGKGKALLRASPPPQPNARVYIHCVIGDALTPSELVSEAAEAKAADEALQMKSQPPQAVHVETGPSAHATAMAPAPRGFDRLLTAGFTAAEVATLRTQFLAIQAHTHTPDTMPTGDELRALEDRWLDSEAGANGATGVGGVTGAEAGQEDTGIEDMLWGNLMGFFWPIACMCWLMREEGVWSRRRQIAVLSGMLVNLTFGFLRLTN